MSDSSRVVTTSETYIVKETVDAISKYIAWSGEDYQWIELHLFESNDMILLNLNHITAFCDFES